MAEKALTLVLYATEPLSPEAFITASSFPSTADDLTLPVLVDICQGLVVLDEGLGVVRFAHFSVQEFLLKEIFVEEGHATVADVTLNLLLIPSPHPSFHAILAYANFNWPIHVRQSGPRSRRLCKEFLSSSIPYNTWVSRVSRKHTELCPNMSGTLSPLIVASFYELEDIVEFLLANETNPNSTNYWDESSLHITASNGNQYITRLLLNHGATVDSSYSTGQTALANAARKGHEGVVRILLDIDGVGLDSRDYDGQTPLGHAAEEGHVKVVQMLLKKGGL